MDIYDLYFKNVYKPPRKRIAINLAYLKSSHGLIRFTLIVCFTFNLTVFFIISPLSI